MKPCVRTSALLLLALIAAPASAQQVKEPVDLLSARTLACLEVRQPEQLAAEVNLLLKDSALDDLPMWMARYRAKHPNDNERLRPDRYFGMSALLFTPETIRELGRLRGAAVALTGFTPEGKPVIVGIILAGDSNIVPCILRILLLESDYAVIAEAEGVPVLGRRHPDYRKANPVEGQKEPPPVVDEGPYLARLPDGGLVIGSDVDAVKDVLKRAKGKSGEPSLGGLAAYREAAKLRERPGLFAYVNPATLSAALDENAQRNPGALADWKAVKALINPSAFRGAVASLVLENGNLELTVRVDQDRLGLSPAVLLLPEKPAAADGLTFAPRDGLLALTSDLSDGQKRWEKLITLLDAYAALRGQSDINLPGKRIREGEEKQGFRFGADVFARLASMTVVVDTAEMQMPTLIFTAKDAEAARALEELLPRVVAVLTNDDPAKPTRQEVDGVSVGDIKGDGVRAPELFYARQGSALVVGREPKRVARVARTGPKKEGQAADPRLAEALKKADNALLLGVVSPKHFLLESIREDLRPVLRRVGGAVGADEPVRRLNLSKQDEELLQSMAATLEPLPPAVVTLTRRGDTLVVEARQTGLRGVSSKFINAYVEGMLDRMGRVQGPGAGPGK